MASFRKTLPAGVYYIGDPSHVMKGDEYEALMKLMFKNRQPIKMEGYFPMPNQTVGVIVHSTGGDGSWEDTDGHGYAADAGMIGLTPAALSDELPNFGGRKRFALGRWVRFGTPVVVTSTKTKLIIKGDTNITIDFEYDPYADSDESSNESAHSSDLPKKARKSPDISATKCKIGTRKKGNDGAMWIIKATKAGVHRWQKA